MANLRKLLFRSCEAADGRKFCFLTHQLDIADRFDHAYKVAYKRKERAEKPEILAAWGSEFTAESQEFELLSLTGEVPADISDAFRDMIHVLIRQIDVFFCDYNLGIEGDLPMCNEILDRYTSTDFVLFSCPEIIGTDPRTQPYMVSYAMPRYETGQIRPFQHRIYCNTDTFSFRMAINAIVSRRTIDNLTGGHIRHEEAPYIIEPLCRQENAEQELNRFVESLRSVNS